MYFDIHRSLESINIRLNTAPRGKDGTYPHFDERVMFGMLSLGMRFAFLAQVVVWAFRVSAFVACPIYGSVTA